MNKTISVIRIAILFVLCGLALMFIFCEEQDRTAWALFLHIIVDKSLGIALCFTISRLYKRWSLTDPWLKAYREKCDEVMDSPDSYQS